MYLVGPSGSGKTVIANRIAKQTSWAVIDTDAEIRTRTGRSIASIFEEEGEETFRSMELGLLEEIARERDHVIVATGGGLPMIPSAMRTMLETGVTIYLEASAEELWARVLGDLEERPLLRGPDGFQRLEAMLVTRAPIYRMATVTVRTERLTVQQVVNLVLSQLPAIDPTALR